MSTAIRPIKIIDTMPKPDELPNGTIYGFYSVTLPGGKKLIPYHHARDYGGRKDTETAFTREWLKTFKRRIVRREEYLSYRASRPPLFVRPSILSDAVYIDIVTAFPSIYKFLGWMTDYVKGKYWGVGEFMPYPLPMAWKAGRSYVISGARHTQYGRYINNGAVVVKPYKSMLSNPPLVAGVYDVLGMCARFAEYALKASYWNVDGGIFPAEAEEIMLSFLASVGLEGRVKYRGEASVLSSGYWRIGQHYTKNFKADKPGLLHAGDFNPVTKEDAEWIYKKFRTITEQRRRDDL